ncbi:hypothetical protein IE077_000654 [Cardiosporidium cionae]|uniref:Uncharacterized protein n=1 Tax=Cardiosporidium cionae TaxID=476202 RepID=A0ABQ7J7U4_9APIC|nr:hypothetical protein IE077_000654 [Cardiosporidium cionae]|eukprot:KAF8819760.1 hypothetical protein IE077_000654 [Cardiosporidium cionae]
MKRVSCQTLAMWRPAFQHFSRWWPSRPHLLFTYRTYRSQPQKKMDPIESLALADRQEGILLENLPSDTTMTPHKISENLQKAGFYVEPDAIFLMKSHLGKSMGRALVLTDTSMDESTMKYFHPQSTYRSVDAHDTSIFIEQCERFHNLSEDLRWLASTDHFHRVVTITEIPTSYGRKELQAVIREHAHMDVPLKNIIFRFTKNGYQSSMAWILCDTKKSANHMIHKIQEIAVPRRFQYGPIAGAAFLWSGRQSLFLSDPSLDFQMCFSKHQIFTTGWQKDVTESEFLLLLGELKFWPSRVSRVFSPIDATASFFMVFDRMKDTKKFMQRLQVLKKRWNIAQEDIFYAYPRQADVYWMHEETYADNDSAADSDLEEPVDY